LSHNGGRADRDQPAAGALEVGERSADRVDGPAQDRRDRRVEVIGIGLDEGPEGEAGGSGDQQVEAAEQLARALDRRRQRLALGHVGGDGLDFEALVAQTPRRRGRPLLAMCQQRHAGSFAGEHLGAGEPDAAAATGDQHSHAVDLRL
jgi:hypothetical protein